LNRRIEVLQVRMSDQTKMRSRHCARRRKGLGDTSGRPISPLFRVDPASFGQSRVRVRRRGLMTLPSYVAVPLISGSGWKSNRETPSSQSDSVQAVHDKTEG
jgi:hypothetical protein